MSRRRGQPKLGCNKSSTPLQIWQVSGRTVTIFAQAFTILQCDKHR
jgi:hypothetical protein